MLQAFLDWHRATLLYKCAGLTGEQLAERAVPPSGLSLLGLIRHMTKVERAWFRQRFADEAVDNPFGGETDADFDRLDPARAAADYARLTQEWKLADAAAANASLDDTFVHSGETMSLRLIYLHMIEEYARHLGHADLLRERIDGRTGELEGTLGGDPLDRLAGDLRDAVVVGVVVQHGRSVQFRGRRDDKVRQREVAVLADRRELTVHVEGTVHGLGGHVHPALRAQRAPERFIRLGVRGVVEVFEHYQLAGSQPALGEQPVKPLPDRRVP